MCPACYINGLLFLIFGATGAAIAKNPWVIAVSIILTIAGFYWMWKSYKKNKGKGGLAKNLKNTLIYILIFAAGFIQPYVTHDYFNPRYDTVWQTDIRSFRRGTWSETDKYPLAELCKSQTA